MQLITLLLSLCVSISLSLAQEAELKTETITMLDASGSTLIATITTPVQDQATQNPTTQPRQRAEQSTFATTTSAPTAAAATSVVQATRTEAYTPASSSSTTNENGIDVEAGASGSASGGFSLSKGGMIAIIVVVVVVAVFGGMRPVQRSEGYLVDPSSPFHNTLHRGQAPPMEGPRIDQASFTAIDWTHGAEKRSTTAKAFRCCRWRD